MALTKTGKPAKLAAFKQANSIKSINVCLSRKGKNYAVDAANGEFLFMIQEGLDVYGDLSEVIVQEYADDYTGETTHYAYIPRALDIVANW